jgi:hypothetical protein
LHQIDANKLKRHQAVYEAAVAARKRASAMARLSRGQTERSLEGASRAAELIERIRKNAPIED